MANARKRHATPPAPQPRHRARVEAAELDEVWNVFYWCATARRVEGVQALTGGLLDAWPAWLVDALPVFDSEVAAVQRYALHLEESHG